MKLIKINKNGNRFLSGYKLIMSNSVLACFRTSPRTSLPSFSQ